MMNIILLRKMNFTLLPSLEHISLANTAVALWKAYSRTSYDYKLDGQQLWNSAESEVTGIVSTLPLPIPLQKKILTFSKGLHWEIAIWVAVDLVYVPAEYISICVSHIHWTNIGTIEKKITVESLVKNESLPITTRYELACMSCLVDDIHKLYERIPDKNIYKDIVKVEINGIYHNNGLIVEWTNYLRNGCLDNITFDILAYANKASLEYLFEEKGKGILTNEEIFAIISGTSKEMNSKRWHSEIIIFLLERMNIVQIELILYMDAYLCIKMNWHEMIRNSLLSNILWCMIHWPWKYCFSETDRCTCKGYCDESNFSKILDCILVQPDDGPLGRSIETFLHRHFWQNLSDPCKKAFMDAKEFELILIILFVIQDQMNIELILEYFTDKKRREFFRENWKIMYQNVMNIKNFNSFELFIREFILSKYEMIWFKANIIERFEGRLQEPDSLKALKLIDEYLSGTKQSRYITALEQ